MRQYVISSTTDTFPTTLKAVFITARRDGTYYNEVHTNHDFTSCAAFPDLKTAINSALASVAMEEDLEELYHVQLTSGT